MAYRITFVIDLFKGEEERELSHETLRYVLFALMLADCAYLRAHPETPNIYESGVVYRLEPPRQEDWLDIPSILKAGNGDCEDLACWRAAELRVRHNIKAEPTFKWTVRPNGAYLYHIQVKLPPMRGETVSRIEDPSRRLGMR